MITPSLLWYLVAVSRLQDGADRAKTATTGQSSTGFTALYKEPFHHLGTVGQAIYKSRPKLVVPIGHTGSVYDASFSPDGSRVVTASNDSTVRIWESRTGRELVSLQGLAGESFASSEYSPDGKFILATSFDTVILWETATLQRVRSTHVNKLASASYSSDGTRILAACGDNTIRVFDASTGKQILDFSPRRGAGVSSATFSPNGQRILGQVDGRGAVVFDARTGRELVSLSDSEYQTAAFSPDGQRIVVGSTGGYISVFDTDTGVRFFEWEGSGQVAPLAFSPNGRSLVTTQKREGSATVWDSVTGQQLFELLGHRDTVYSASYSRDGKLILTSSADMTARVWDSGTGKELAKLGGGGKGLNDARFSSNGKRLVCASADKTARVWDLERGIESLRLHGHEGVVTSASFSPQGSNLLTSGRDYSARIWDAEHGRQLRSLEAEPLTGSSIADLVSCAAFSPDSSRIVTASYDHTARVWNAQTGKELYKLGSHGDIVTCAEYSPNGLQIATGAYDEPVSLWDAKSGRLMMRLKDSSDAIDVAYCRDGSRIAARNIDGRTAVWDLRTGKELVRFADEGDVTGGVDFSRDGSSVITGSGPSGIASIFSSRTGRKLLDLKGHTRSVTKASFSSDGRFVVTSSWDGTARIWDASTGKELCSLISLDNGWVVTDPEGHFDCDDLEKAASELYWIAPDAPLKPLPLEIFVRQYYEPKLLARIMKGEKIPEVKNIMDLNRVQPKVEILSIAPSKVTDAVDVTVKVTGMDPDPTRDGPKSKFSGAQEFRLFRDGRLVAHLDKLNLGQDHTWSATYSAIPLAHDGKQDIEFSAYAFNTDLVKSETVKTAYKPLAALVRKPGKAYIMSIGVDAFDDPSLELQHAADDARDVQRSVPPRVVGGREVVRLNLISDGSKKDAVKRAFKEAVDNLAKKATPDDVILITWSGHGYAAADGKFYLIPSDTGTPFDVSKRTSLDRAISSDELSLWLQDVDGGDMALIIDACQSGASVEGEGFKPGPLGSKGLGQLAYDKGLMVLAASQANDFALESEKLGHGLLSYALIDEGLDQKKAPFKNGSLSLRKWLSYAVDRVPSLYQDLLSGKLKALTGKAVSATDQRRRARSDQGGQHPQFYDFNRRSGDGALLSAGN